MLGSKVLNDAEIGRLMSVQFRQSDPQLYFAMGLALFAGAKLRDITTFMPSHVDRQKNRITIRNKRVPVVPSFIADLVSWLDENNLRGETFAFNFDQEATKKAIQRRMAKHGIEMPGIESLRRTYANRLLNAGVSLPTIRRIAG